jgi:GxxExxY protein
LRHEELTFAVIGAAIDVHRELGPGLLESVYEACLAYELATRGLHVERQRPVAITYKDVALDIGYRLDLVVERTLIVEPKRCHNWSGCTNRKCSRTCGSPTYPWVS